VPVTGVFGGAAPTSDSREHSSKRTRGWALQERERRHAQLRAELAATRKPEAFDERRILAQLRASLAEWRVTLRQDVPQARTALRALLAGRLVFTPREDQAAASTPSPGPARPAKFIAGLALPTGTLTS